MSVRPGRGTVIAAVLALLALAVLWVLRPMFHGIVMLFYAHPGVLEAVLVLLVGGYLAFRIGVSDAGATETMRAAARDDGGGEFARFLLANSTGRRVAAGVLVGVVALALVVLLPTLGSAYAQEHVANTLSVEDTDTLPEIDAERPRVLPGSVARQYATNSLQFPRYRLAAGDIAMRDGSPTWSFGLAPDGGVNNILLVGRGAVFVDMTTQGKRVSVVESEQSVGFGLGLAGGSNIVSEYRWRLQKGEYLVNYEDPIMIEHEGEVHMAVPYTSYNHHLRLLPVPSVHATPEWGGVALIGPEGSIEHLTPEEARQNAVLAEQRLYPFELARYQVSAMRYKGGLLNKWFVHEDELELAAVPGEGNEQPFFAVTEEQGLQYFVAAEPFGDAQGIYQVWTFDARTGETKRFQLPVDSALMGPRKAANFVRKANDRTDWDRFSPSEPVPAVVNDTLYWQVRVVPSDSSGIAFTAFVNAETGDVYSYSTDGPIRAFLAGEVPGEQRPGDGGDDEPRDAVVIEVRDADGNVVNRVTVGPDQTVEIRPGNATATTTTTTAP